MSATTHEPTADGVPLVPLLLSLGLELGRRGRHAEAVEALRKALAEPEEKPLDTITRALLEQLLAAGDREAVLRDGLELAAMAPAAVVPTLRQLTPVLRPALLQPVASLLTESAWTSLLGIRDLDLLTRRGLLAFFGRARLVLGDAHQAGALLRDNLAIVDGDPELLLLLADCELQAWRFNDAEQALAKAERAAGSTEHALQVTLRLVRLYEQTGRPAEVLDRVRDLPAGDPAVAAELHALKALALLDLGDLDGAREASRTALEMVPTSAAAAVGGACVNLADHDYPRAKDTANAGLARHQQHKALSFLRFQAIVEAGEELDRIDRRLSRFLGKLAPAEIELYLNRSTRTRSDADPALHYFLGLVHRALDRPDVALAELDRATELLGDQPEAEWRLISALVHRLRALLLEPDDPAAAAAEYTSAGLLAFDHEQYELAVDLLTRAAKLQDLSQTACWTLAEALFFLSFVPTEPGGVALDKIQQAVDVWQRAIERGLPEADVIWTYVSRARINLQLARVAPDPYPLLVEAMLYCECFAVYSLGTEAYFRAFGNACRLLGLYGLHTDVLAEAVGPPAQRNVEPLPVDQLITSAANAGDLERMRATLPALQYLANSSAWREDEARYHILNNDPAAARAGLDAVAPDDRSPTYHLWMRILADWQLGDRAALEADLGQCAAAAERDTEDWTGLTGWMWLLSGDPSRAMERFAGLVGVDSWSTDPAMEVALCQLVEHKPDAEADVSRFIAETTSYEDVQDTGAMLGVLAQRYGDTPDGALARLRRQADDRLAAGGWPLDLSGDLDRLLASAVGRDADDKAGVDATIVERAIRARVAIRNQAWSAAVAGYRALIPHLDRFPEVEIGLTLVAGELSLLADGWPDEVVAPAGELVEAVAELRRHGSRRIGPQPPELLLGDLHFVLRDYPRARELYQVAADLGGSAETHGYALTRLHVLSALEDRPEADDQLRHALRNYQDAGFEPAATVCLTGLAMITEPADWRRLLGVWDRTAGSHEFGDELILAGRHALAGLYHAAEQVAEAEAEYRDVVLARSRVLGPDHLDTLASRHELGRVLQARGNWAEAEVEHRAVTEARQRMWGDRDAATLSARAELAWVLYCRDEWTAAEREYRAVLAGYGADPDTLAIRYELGLTLLAKNDYAAARAEFQTVADGREALLGLNDRTAVSARFQEALTIRLLGDPASAGSLFESLLARRRALLGEDHPDTLATRHQLAITMAQRGDHAAAAAEFAAVADARTRVLGPLHPGTLSTRRELAASLLNSEDIAAAVAEYRAVAAARAETLGERDPATLAVRRDVAFALFRQGDYPAAEAEYRTVLSAMRDVLGDDDRQTVGVWHDWAALLRLLEDWPAAAAELRTVLAKMITLDGEDHPETLATRTQLARTLAGGDDQAGAEAEFRAALAGLIRTAGADDPETLNARGELADHLASTGDLDAAEADYRATLGGWNRTAGPDDPATLAARAHLASFLAAVGKSADAEAEYRILVETTTRVFGEHHPETLAARWELAWLLAGRDDWAAAEAEYRRVIEARAAREDPLEGAAHYQLGNVLRRQGRFDEALAELETAAAAAPSSLDMLAARLEIGLTRDGMGESAAAEAELRAVVSGRAEQLGPDDARTVSARIELARVLAARQEHDAAEAEYRAAVLARERADGPDHPNTLTAKYFLAGAIAAQGRLDEAATVYRAVLEGEVQRFGADHPNPRLTRNDLIDVLIDQGDLVTAEAECRTGIAALGTDDLATPPIRQRLAFILRERGELEAAESEYRAALSGMERELGPTDQNTLATRHQLAFLLFELGNLPAAETEFRSVLAGLGETLGPDHPQTLDVRMDVGTVLRARGEFAGAVAELRATADDLRRVLGEDAPATLENRLRLVLALRDAGEPGAAETELRAGLASLSRALGPEDPVTLEWRAELARFLSEMDNPTAAEVEYRTLADTWDKMAGPDHPQALAHRYNLGGSLAGQDRWADAMVEYRAVLDRETQLLGPRDPSTLLTHHQLAVALFGVGDLDAALAELRAVVPARTEALGAEHPHTLHSRLVLARVLAARDEPDEAVAEYRAALDGHIRLLGADDPNTLAAGVELAEFLVEQDRLAEAEALYRLLIDASQALDEDTAILRSMVAAFENLQTRLDDGR